MRHRAVNVHVQALEHIHSVGIVHRDVKSANVLISRDCEGDGAGTGFVAALCDFDSAVRVDDDDAERLCDLGTVGYQAPEQLRSRRRPRADERQQPQRRDVYAFGVVLWELLHPQYLGPWGDDPGIGAMYLELQRCGHSDANAVHSICVKLTDAVKRKVLDKQPRKSKVGTSDVARTLEQLMAQCLKHEWQHRPSATFIVTRLRECEEQLSHALPALCSSFRGNSTS
jgi:serine/threonine protein kinase